MIVGSGPIGIELCQAFRRLDIDVFVIDKGYRILPKEDRDASYLLYQ